MTTTESVTGDETCHDATTPVTDTPVSELDAARGSRLFKALADPARLRLYSVIVHADPDICVCNIPDVGISQPTVSHHLRKLREAGLIECERRGRWVYYRATPDVTADLSHMLGTLFKGTPAEAHR